jgi:hypothetical protein
MIDHRPFMLGIMFSAWLGGSPFQAESLDPVRQAHPMSVQAVHEAEYAVDYAWEIYHRAALGGTVASPALQADIEQHLHEARTLMSQAQDAAGRGDTRQVERLIGQIKIHTSQAIEESKEQKK